MNVENCMTLFLAFLLAYMTHLLAAAFEFLPAASCKKNRKEEEHRERKNNKTTASSHPNIIYVRIQGGERGAMPPA